MIIVNLYQVTFTNIFYVSVTTFTYYRVVGGYHGQKSDMNKKRETIEGQRKSYYVTSADLSKQIKDLNKTRAFTSEVDLHIMSNFIRGCCQDRTKGINE